jgi:hypothetical protein
MTARAFRTLLLLLAFAFCACSSFERDWRAAQTQRGTKRDPYAGVWDGKWTSALHGSPEKPAGGRLRCIFTPLDAETYRAYFKANWHGLATTYKVDFRTERHGGELRFRGEYDLGLLAGGVYRYDGRVTPERFESSYDSSYDTGRFEMARPKPPPPPRTEN